MEYFAQMISEPWMVTVFVSIILLVALRPLYQAIFSVSAVNNDVTEATNVLAELGKNKQEEFYNQFNAINTRISRIPGLRHTWRQFVDSMYFENANIPNTPKRAYVSHRPSHYFNRDSVLGTRLNLAQFFAYPNYLIGIGLTFTFIGLAAALHVAQEGLASGVGQQALKDLLAVAALKFISSIAGIASSLLISVIQRVAIRTFQQKLNLFCDLLEECTRYKSAEKLLHDSFNEQRRQTIIFNDMPKRISDSVSDAFSHHLSASVAGGLEPLTQDIRALAKNFADGSEDALRKMSEAFLGELRKNSLAEIQALMDSVGVLKESLHQTTTQFVESLHSLQAIAGSIEQAGGKMQDAAGDNKHSAQLLGKIIADISPQLTSMSSALSSLSQSLENVEKTAVNLKGAGENITLAAGEFKHSAASIKPLEENFKQNMETLKSLTQGISKMIDMLESTSEQVGHAAISLQSLDRQFSKSVDNLGDTLKQLPVTGDREGEGSRSLFRVKPRWWRK